MHWYNHDHRHSGIRYVSPAQRHEGADIKILAAWHEVWKPVNAIRRAGQAVREA